MHAVLSIQIDELSVCVSQYDSLSDGDRELITQEKCLPLDIMPTLLSEGDLYSRSLSTLIRFYHLEVYIDKSIMVSRPFCLASYPQHHAYELLVCCVLSDHVHLPCYQIVSFWGLL